MSENQNEMGGISENWQNFSKATKFQRNGKFQKSPNDWLFFLSLINLRKQWFAMKSRMEDDFFAKGI